FLTGGIGLGLDAGDLFLAGGVGLGVHAGDLFLHARDLCLARGLGFGLHPGDLFLASGFGFGLAPIQLLRERLLGIGPDAGELVAQLRLDRRTYACELGVQRFSRFGASGEAGLGDRGFTKLGGLLFDPRELG